MEEISSLNVPYASIVSLLTDMENLNCSEKVKHLVNNRGLEKLLHLAGSLSELRQALIDYTTIIMRCLDDSAFLMLFPEQCGAHKIDENFAREYSLHKEIMDKIEEVNTIITKDSNQLKYAQIDILPSLFSLSKRMKLIDQQIERLSLFIQQ